MTGKMVNQHGKTIKPFGLGVDVMQLNDLLQAAGIGLDELGLCSIRLFAAACPLLPAPQH